MEFGIVMCGAATGAPMPVWVGRQIHHLWCACVARFCNCACGSTPTQTGTDTPVTRSGHAMPSGLRSLGVEMTPSHRKPNTSNYFGAKDEEWTAITCNVCILIHSKVSTRIFHSRSLLQ